MTRSDVHDELSNGNLKGNISEISEPGQVLESSDQNKSIKTKSVAQPQSDEQVVIVDLVHTEEARIDGKLGAVEEPIPQKPKILNMKPNKDVSEAEEDDEDPEAGEDFYSSGEEPEGDAGEHEAEGEQYDEDGEEDDNNGEEEYEEDDDDDNDEDAEPPSKRRK